MRSLNFAIILSAIIIIVLLCRNTTIEERKGYRLMFYNVENLFDTIDDPNTIDEEFLPDGKMQWSGWKYHYKLRNIYKVIMAAGEGSPPDIIGMCEIENALVVKDLIYKTPLIKYNYSLVHFDSPDARGIDVSMIYRKDSFKLFIKRRRTIVTEDTTFKTRDILMAGLQTKNGDSIYVFVNHWPSKRGGSISEVKRREVALILRKMIDSLRVAVPLARIVMMGDFNDSPIEKSITEHLGAKSPTTPIKEDQLYNLSNSNSAKNVQGTHKYREEWSILDQFIVSGSLFSGKNYVTVTSYHIFEPSFLLEEDKEYLGVKPFRAFRGPMFTKGFSDHLPVLLDVYVSN